jgi:hypothetical protein
MSLLDELAIEFGLGRNDLNYLIATAPRRYKSYEIPKRRGGFRTIAQPSRELKALQRYILSAKLQKFPVHSAATAYVQGKGIRDNASPHQNSRVLLKLDFERFFPSIRPRDFTRYVLESETGEIEVADLPLYEKLLFWGEGKPSPKSLSIGAPTSPMVSNILLRRLDEALSSAARELNVIYTRYADDITTSADSVEDVIKFERACRSIVSKLKSPKLSFNEAKRGLYLPGQKQMVTGLILTPVGGISIGRERKREISALLHRVTLDELDAERMSRLKGLLGFCIACEPEFVTRMRTKYGDQALDRVLQFAIPPRTQRRG